MNTDKLNSLAEITAEYCREKLDLDSVELGCEYRYPNLPLCIIDTVFSIGVSYVSTSNTVNRFCKFLGTESTYESFSVHPFSLIQYIHKECSECSEQERTQQSTRI